MPEIKLLPFFFYYAVHPVTDARAGQSRFGRAIDGGPRINALPIATPFPPKVERRDVTGDRTDRGYGGVRAAAGSGRRQGGGRCRPDYTERGGGQRDGGPLHSLSRPGGD